MTQSSRSHPTFVEQLHLRLIQRRSRPTLPVPCFSQQNVEGVLGIVDGAMILGFLIQLAQFKKPRHNCANLRPLMFLDVPEQA